MDDDLWHTHTERATNCLTALGAEQKQMRWGTAPSPVQNATGTYLAGLAMQGRRYGKMQGEGK